MLDPNADDRRYFFPHVFFVPGMPILFPIETCVFERRFLYPNAEDTDSFAAYMDYGYVKRLPEERKRRTKLFTGHLPLAAARYFGPDLRTFAFFCDPVERAIVHLLDWIATHPAFAGRTPEAVWNDRSAHAAYFDNIQLRFFAIPDLEHGGDVFTPMPLDRGSVRRALEAVRGLDFIGLMEDFDRSMHDLGRAFSWPLPDARYEAPVRDVSVPPALLEQITADLELDRAFYEGVRGIYQDRLDRPHSAAPVPPK